MLLFASSVPAGAQAPKTLSGTWSASQMRSAWNVGDWGEACGPKPGGGSAPAGTVTIRQSGGELSISGAGRSYSTAECWEQMPGLSRSSHSGGQRGWRTVCKSAASDPRQATVVTTVSASDTYITFDETGQYQFVIQGSNCTASVRRSRSFRLIQREGEAPAPASAPSASGAPATAAAASEKPAVPARCEKPGAPARLEVRPSRKLMRPGEQFGFRAVVSDAAGCALATAPVWKIAKNESFGQLVAPGKIRVADDAPESEIALSATVADRSVEVVVEVASKERYEALLKSRGFTQEGESTETAATAIASGSVGSRSAVTSEGGVSLRRVTFVAMLGSAALVLGVVGVVLALRSRRRQRVPPPEPVPTSLPPPAPQTLAIAGPAREQPNTPNMICPTCREEYPPYASFCERDGNRLIAVQQGGDQRGPTGGMCPVCGQGFDPGVSICPRHGEELVPAAVWGAREEAAAGFKICPVCGTQYPGDGRFCGSDGAALVPVN
jgi:hypothetical protein